MRAAVAVRAGGPSVLKVREIPVPPVGANDVLIAVEAAGVGSWDAAMRGGWSPAGKNEYCYSFGGSKGGFYAEYCSVSASKVSKAPRRLDSARVAAAATVGLTALQGIDGALHVKRGERVVVHGASGGVGMMALQLAKWRGARVLGTADGRAGVAFVQRLGADAAVDGKSRAGMLAEKLREFAPDGVDAVLATVGGPSLGVVLDALRKGGRVAWPNGIEPAPRKRKGIRMKGYDAKEGADELAKLTRAIEASKPKVAIAARYPMARAAAAHRRLAKGHVFGKIVLVIRGR